MKAIVKNPEMRYFTDTMCSKLIWLHAEVASERS